MTTVMRILVVGAGGHARVCIEALQDDPGHMVVGCVSRDGGTIDGLGRAALGTDDDLEDLVGHHAITHGFLAVGDNAARRELAGRWKATGLPLVAAVSRFARLSHAVIIGEGAALLPGATVNAATSVGRGAIINTNASVDHDCVVGEFVHIAPGVAVAGGVQIGGGVFIGIGASVTPGRIIGEGSIIGAGAVVLHDVPANVTVVGVPARIVKRST